MYNPNDSSDRNRRAFSMRTWMVLTLHAVVLLGFAMIFRPTFVRWWPYPLLAALPMLGVFLVNATATVSGHRSALSSLPIFGVALLMPALRLASDLAFGYSAFLLSFYGITLFREWGSTGESFWYPIACTMGALVNLLLIAGYCSYLAGCIRLARWSASLGFCLSLCVTLALARSTELNGIYLGHGLWVTSLLALSFGSWRTAGTGRDQESEGQSDKSVTKRVMVGTALFCVLAPIGVTIALMIRSSMDRHVEHRAVNENDAKIVIEVEQQLAEHLANLPPTDPNHKTIRPFCFFVRCRASTTSGVYPAAVC